jgi:NAD(P)-dependent dehydrogenase (short-subunit alcohol dehydrogenase family)
MRDVSEGEETLVAGDGRLKDRVAVVTGGAAGIGLATVRAMVAEGALVVAGDINEERLREEHAGADAVVPVALDVASPESAAGIVQTAIDTFGRVDVLCNVAGIVDRFLQVGEMEDEVWSRVLAVNLTGPMMTARAAIPHMLEHGSGAIVNVASVAAFTGARGGAAYAASKAGLVAMTRTITATYGRDGIRAVAVCPGSIATGISWGGEPSELGRRTFELAKATYVDPAPPEDLASVVVFAASDDARFVNGTSIVVDGGWTVP